MWIERQGSYTLPTGLSFSDAIVIPGSTGETEIFARGYGRVGWSGPFSNYMVRQDPPPPPAAPPCGDAPGSTSGSGLEGCPPATSGYYLFARAEGTAEALVETKSDCSGINVIKCAIESFLSWVMEGFHPVERSFAYGARAGIHQTIKWAQTVGLIKTSGGTREYDGIVARMLPPRYRQENLDPKEQLAKSEGQMSKGTIRSNQNRAMSVAGDATGVYEVDWENSDYEIDAYWLYIPAFFYKFDLIRQTFSAPGARRANIPRVQCDKPYEEATIINEQYGDPNLRQFGRNVLWRLEDDPDCDSTYGEPGENGVCPYRKEVDCTPTDPNDPDCNSIPDEEGEDNICPCRGSGSTRITAPLTTENRIPLATEGWQALAGGNGALDIFKLPVSTAAPDGWTFRRDDNNEVATKFTYHGESGDTVTPRVTLWARDLGTVRDSLSCIINQLLMPPSKAAKGICESVIIKPRRIACTGLPPCWAGSPHDIETQRPECPQPYDRCTAVDYSNPYYELIPGCVYGLDSETMHYVLFCWGNNYRACDTDPHFPNPDRGRKDSGWVGAGEFPNGAVLYNGYTYTPPSDYPWSGVFWCDSNSFACDNQICLGGGTLIASGSNIETLGETLAARDAKEKDLASELLSQDTKPQQKQSKPSFFTRIANALSNAVRVLFQP